MGYAPLLATSSFSLLGCCRDSTSPAISKGLAEGHLQRALARLQRPSSTTLPGLSVLAKPPPTATCMCCLCNRRSGGSHRASRQRGGCAPASPGPLAGRSHSIVSMTFSHRPRKGEEEDAGLPACFFLLSVQDLASCEIEDPGVVLTTALSLKLRGRCRKPIAALPPAGWAQQLPGTALHLPPDFLVRAWKGLTSARFPE